jgi:DNA (cytosine-5)-methyltransferase 1
MKFLDLFSGIGGFRLAMVQAGHKCLGFCESDKFARKSYKTIYNTENEVEMHDIRKVSDEFIRDIRNIDIICGGFPCQAFSIAGKRQGFRDTRGTLFFEIMRFASLLRPRYLLLENVKGLLNHEAGATFETILNALDEVGYDVEWEVLNAKDFLPQNRERVFIIGHLRGKRTRKIFPIERKNIPLTENRTIEKSLILPVLTPERLKKRQNGRRFKSNGTLTSQDRHGIMFAPNLTTLQDDRQTPMIFQKPRGYNKGGEHEISPTLSSNSWQENHFLKQETNIRKLTPRECFRLQGFPDWVFDKAQSVNSDSQLYKQAGNSVVVPIVYEIAKRL